MGKRKELTHEDRVLRFMEDTGSITSWQAIQQFGNTRLSATIFLLRKKGYVIENETKYSTNRYGEPVHFVKYKLVGKPSPFKDGLFRIFGINK